MESSKEYLPDWSPGTIKFVENFINKRMSIFEWGTGFSTLWLAQRAGIIYSMEHSQEWFDRIRELAYGLNLHNIHFHLKGLERDEYYTSVANYDTGLIIIDGRNRVRCFFEAIKMDIPILFDDTERERYSSIFAAGLEFTNLEADQKGQRATIFYPRRLK